MTHSFRSRGRRAAEVRNRLHFVGPLPEDTGNVGGVGLYHQRFIEAVAGVAPKDCDLLVHSQKAACTPWPPHTGNIRVRAAWRTGLAAAIDLWSLVFAKPGTFIIQYEVQLFGSVIVSLLLPALITCIRSRGSRVLILMHHIISPAVTSETLKDWKQPSIIDGMALAVLRGNQWLIASAASAAIVHERDQAMMLPPRRTFVVPHGVAVREARKQTAVFEGRPLRVALFGFIAPYKGSLEAAEALAQLVSEGLRIELNIVGGEHPRMRTSSDYQGYIVRLHTLAEAHPELCMKGFIPASELDNVLLESDLVILPYKAAIGVSGALSYVIGLGMPVAVSEVLGRLMDLPDEIPRFDPTVAGISAFLRHTLMSRDLPATEPVRALAMARSWPAVGKRVWDIVGSVAP